MRAWWGWAVVGAYLALVAWVLRRPGRRRDQDRIDPRRFWVDQDRQDPPDFPYT